ncbi:MAG: pyridoxamine 5'-phosphate oxidase family protein [Acidobacteria bacterium]|nr:pyridoxamine 5'-phosphate oxidase family protein [Acidobacteriota bacterium]
MAKSEPASIQHLSESECWKLLRTHVLGRLAVVVEDHPEIFPVNYAADGESVIFRTAEGTKLHGALDNTPVAFEIDGYEPATEQAWSVVLRGSAVQLTRAPELDKAAKLPLEAWQSGAKDHLMRIGTSKLSGRQFRVTKPDVWTTPLTDARRASFE